MEFVETSLPTFQYWARKLQGFKWFMFADYGINMITSVFNNLFFSAYGMSLSYLYLLNGLGLFFAAIFQNYISIFSDKINRRYIFLVIGHICTVHRHFYCSNLAEFLYVYLFYILL